MKATYVQTQNLVEEAWEYDQNNWNIMYTRTSH